MDLRQSIALAALLAGAFFFLAGTVGLLRLPDVYSRLHAVTKADNLGLGLMLFGLALQAWDAMAALKLLFIWLLVMLASTSACHLVARAALQMHIEPWKRS